MEIILKFLKGKRLKYIGAMFTLIITGSMNMLQPLIIRSTIDSVIGTNPFDGKISSFFYFLGGREHLLYNLWILSLILILITIIQNIFTYLQGVWSAEASEHFAKGIKDELYNHIQHLPYKSQVNVKNGEFIQRSTSDVETIRKFLSKQFLSIGRIVTTVFLVLISMFNLNVKLTLLSSILVPFIIGFSIYFFIKVKDIFQHSDEAEADLTSALHGNLNGIRVVRAFGKQEFEINKFDEKNLAFKNSRIKLIRMLAIFWSSSDFLCLTQVVIIFISGLYMTLNGDITLGTMVAFVFYSEKLIWPVQDLGKILTEAGQGSVSLKRIKEILDMEVEDLKGNNNDFKMKGDIIFEDIHFSYDNGVEILKGLSFEVKAGETVAILGATGSGKSTLMYLLVRLFDLEKGRILIDGVDIKKINKGYLRKNVGIILQEAFLFSKTIKENIGVVNKNTKIEDIYNAAHFANIHHAIEDFKDGYDTMVGEQGVTLSGGQKQRVAIARTLINNSKILIFDDSLSAVDSKTDTNIRNSIRERKDNITTFIISHRISTLSQADKIIVLGDGIVKNIGTHNELIKVDGLYKTAYDIEKINETDVSE